MKARSRRRDRSEGRRADDPFQSTVDPDSIVSGQGSGTERPRPWEDDHPDGAAGVSDAEAVLMGDIAGGTMLIIRLPHDRLTR
jgi:hypothetical protein